MKLRRLTTLLTVILATQLFCGCLGSENEKKMTVLVAKRAQLLDTMTRVRGSITLEDDLKDLNGEIEDLAKVMRAEANAMRTGAEAAMAGTNMGHAATIGHLGSTGAVPVQPVSTFQPPTTPAATHMH